MNILRWQEAKYPAAFASAFTENPLYQPQSLRYYQAYYADEFTELSFAVVLAGKVLARVFLTVRQQQLSYFGLPLVWYLNPEVDPQQQQGAFKVLCKELNKLRQQHQVVGIRYQQAAGNADLFTEYLLEQGFSAQVRWQLQLDLTQPVEALWQQLRAVYHSNIQFGQQQLQYQLLSATPTIAPSYPNTPAQIASWQAPSAQCLASMQSFHIAIAGRETRSDLSWREQEQMLQTGEAFALLGVTDQQQLVSTGLFIFNSVRCYYGVGVYERSLFEHPISHDLVWRGILQAKALGCVWFEFGDIPFSGQLLGDALPSAKEVNIGHFKRGFGGLLVAVLQF